MEDDQVEGVGHYLALLWSRTALLAEQSGLPAPVELGDDGGGGDDDASSSELGHVLRVKVSLAGIRPPIWRRLELPASLTLRRLHDVLQAVFGCTCTPSSCCRPDRCAPGYGTCAPSR